MEFEEEFIEPREEYELSEEEVEDVIGEAFEEMEAEQSKEPQEEVLQDIEEFLKLEQKKAQRKQKLLQFNYEQTYIKLLNRDIKQTQDALVKLNKTKITEKNQEFFKQKEAELTTRLKELQNEQKEYEKNPKLLEKKFNYINKIETLSRQIVSTKDKEREQLTKRLKKLIEKSSKILPTMDRITFQRYTLFGEPKRVMRFKRGRQTVTREVGLKKEHLSKEALELVKKLAKEQGEQVPKYARTERIKKLFEEIPEMDIEFETTTITDIVHSRKDLNRILDSEGFGNIIEIKPAEGKTGGFRIVREIMIPKSSAHVSKETFQTLVSLNKDINNAKRMIVVQEELRDIDEDIKNAKEENIPILQKKQESLQNELNSYIERGVDLEDAVAKRTEFLEQFRKEVVRREYVFKESEPQFLEVVRIQGKKGPKFLGVVPLSLGGKMIKLNKSVIARIAPVVFDAKKFSFAETKRLKLIFQKHKIDPEKILDDNIDTYPTLKKFILDKIDSYFTPPPTKSKEDVASGPLRHTYPETATYIPYKKITSVEDYINSLPVLAFPEKATREEFAEFIARYLRAKYRFMPGDNLIKKIRGYKKRGDVEKDLLKRNLEIIELFGDDDKIKDIIMEFIVSPREYAMSKKSKREIKEILNPVVDTKRKNFIKEFSESFLQQILSQETEGMTKEELKSLKKRSIFKDLFERSIKKEFVTSPEKLFAELTQKYKIENDLGEFIEQIEDKMQQHIYGTNVIRNTERFLYDVMQRFKKTVAIQTQSNIDDLLKKVFIEKKLEEADELIQGIDEWAHMTEEKRIPKRPSRRPSQASKKSPKEKTPKEKSPKGVSPKKVEKQKTIYERFPIRTIIARDIDPKGKIFQGITLEQAIKQELASYITSGEYNRWRLFEYLYDIEKQKLMKKCKKEPKIYTDYFAHYFCNRSKGMKEEEILSSQFKGLLKRDPITVKKDIKEKIVLGFIFDSPYALARYIFPDEYIEIKEINEIKVEKRAKVYYDDIVKKLQPVNIQDFLKSVELKDIDVEAEEESFLKFEVRIQSKLEEYNAELETIINHYLKPFSVKRSEIIRILKNNLHKSAFSAMNILNKTIDNTIKYTAEKPQNIANIGVAKRNYKLTVALEKFVKKYTMIGEIQTELEKYNTVFEWLCKGVKMWTCLDKENSIGIACGNIVEKLNIGEITGTEFVEMSLSELLPEMNEKTFQDIVDTMGKLIYETLYLYTETIDPTVHIPHRAPVEYPVIN